MANKNIPLTIVRPIASVQQVTFEAYVTESPFQIPFRYPFVDIANYAGLKTAGFFRHGLKQYPEGGSASAVTSAELNPGSDTGGHNDSADSNAQLGYLLPHTEKLVLLVKVNTLIGGTDVTVTIAGSEQYSIPDVTFAIPSATAVGEVFEFPLFDFGLYLQRGSGIIKITAASSTTDDEEHLSFALVSRAA